MKNIDRAAAARRLTENEDFRTIVCLIEADIFEAFRNVDIGDTEALERTHQLSHGFKLLNQRIAKYIEIAKFEAEIASNSEDL
ncbi:hypothetical protein [Endobacterium cereale]|uniref:hypothetical protein n=1 Tax=Endobacterium cereale TaxID=2663029 RepID=UPI002B48CA57|nr:hypothetical protein [Endobacterium cereale]MEB2843802.1 hypothetical protein [Endobacterium cereale]